MPCWRCSWLLSPLFVPRKLFPLMPNSFRFLGLAEPSMASFMCQRGKGRFLPCCGITVAKDALASNRNWPRSTTRMDLCFSCPTGGDRGNHRGLTSWMRFVPAVPLWRGRPSKLPTKT
jgi:hypothetical protein